MAAAGSKGGGGEAWRVVRGLIGERRGRGRTGWRGPAGRDEDGKRGSERKKKCGVGLGAWRETLRTCVR